VLSLRFNATGKTWGLISVKIVGWRTKMTVSKISGSQVSLGVSPWVSPWVSPLSWTNDVLAELGGDIPLEVCLKDAAENGYDGVELGRKFPREAHELLSKLSSYGLRLATGWHSGYLTERSVEAEWKAAADHVQLLESCGCQVLVYGECGMMEGDSPWDEPLSRGTKLKSIDLAAYAERLTEFAMLTLPARIAAKFSGALEIEWCTSI
jgi:sugar phosphate isomerase/epimerase